MAVILPGWKRRLKSLLDKRRQATPESRRCRCEFSHFSRCQVGGAAKQFREGCRLRLAPLHMVSELSDRHDLDHCCRTAPAQRELKLVIHHSYVEAI